LKQVQAQPLKVLYRLIEEKRREEKAKKMGRPKTVSPGRGRDEPPVNPVTTKPDEIVLGPPEAEQAVQQKTPNMPPPAERLKAQATEVAKKHRSGNRLTPREIKVAIKQLDRAGVAEISDFCSTYFYALALDEIEQDCQRQLAEFESTLKAKFKSKKNGQSRATLIQTARKETTCSLN
jgi:hypothetical protein